MSYVPTGGDVRGGIAGSRLRGRPTLVEVAVDRQIAAEKCANEASHAADHCRPDIAHAVMLRIGRILAATTSVHHVSRSYRFSCSSQRRAVVVREPARGPRPRSSNVGAGRSGPWRQVRRDD